MLNQHQTIKDNIAKYNKVNPLADFLIPFIGDKKDVKILDVGSGPYSIIGHYLEGVTVEMHHADTQEFEKFWDRYKALPLIEIEYEEMEDLSYHSDIFDIVCCINALDHTNNPYAAVEEMIRVCKPRGYIYIDCHLDQLSTGHKHKWNAKEDGVLTNGTATFDLKDFGFEIEYIDNGGESRYNRIVATLHRP